MKAISHHDSHVKFRPKSFRLQAIVDPKHFRPFPYVTNYCTFWKCIKESNFLRAHFFPEYFLN